MLTKANELEANKLLADGYKISKVAHKTNLTQNEVRIARDRPLVESLSNEERILIKNLIAAALPIGAISKKTKISEDVIAAVKRQCYYERRTKVKDRPHKCACCGSVLFENVQQEDQYIPPTPRSSEVPAWQFMALYRIAVDVINLGSLQCIYHPLFYDLVEQVKSTMKEIANEKEEAKATM